MLPALGGPGGGTAEQLWAQQCHPQLLQMHDRPKRFSNCQRPISRGTFIVRPSSSARHPSCTWHSDAPAINSPSSVRSGPSGTDLLNFSPPPPFPSSASILFFTLLSGVVAKEGADPGAPGFPVGRLSMIELSQSFHTSVNKYFHLSLIGPSISFAGALSSFSPRPLRVVERPWRQRGRG